MATNIEYSTIELHGMVLLTLENSVIVSSCLCGWTATDCGISLVTAKNKWKEHHRVTLNAILEKRNGTTRCSCCGTNLGYHSASPYCDGCNRDAYACCQGVENG